MSEQKIAAFYDDAVKRTCDAYSVDKAHYLRALSTGTGLNWRTRRMVKFVGQLGVGTVRQLRERLSPRGFERAGAPARSGAG